MLDEGVVDEILVQRTLPKVVIVMFASGVNQDHAFDSTIIQLFDMISDQIFSHACPQEPVRYIGVGIHRLQSEVTVDGLTDLHEELGHVVDRSDRYSNSIRAYVGIGDQIHHSTLLSDNAHIGNGILLEFSTFLRIKYVTYFHLIRRFQLHLPVGGPDSHHMVGGR